jgi:opacity protein-like surface antigen
MVAVAGGLFACDLGFPAQAQTSPPAGYSAPAQPPAGNGNQRSGFYFAGKGGPSFLDTGSISTSTGAALREDSGSNLVGAFGMAGGYTWTAQGLPLRTELELMNRTEVTFDSSPLLRGAGTNYALASTVQDISLMLRGYWHFKLGDPKIWSPFLSAGAGVARNTVKGDLTTTGSGAVQHLDKTTYAPAWSLGTGASFYLGNNVVNDIELRYVDLGKAQWGITGAPDLETRSLRGAELIFALRYNF